MNNPNLMLVQCLLGLEPKDDARIVSCQNHDDITTLVLRKDTSVSAEFLDGWTWMFHTINPNNPTTIVMDRQRRHATLTAGLNNCRLSQLALTVKELRTIRERYHLMRTEAGIFILHPRHTVIIGDRLVCKVNHAVAHHEGQQGISCVQICFSERQKAWQIDSLSKLWETVS